MAAWQKIFARNGGNFSSTIEFETARNFGFVAMVKVPRLGAVRTCSTGILSGNYVDLQFSRPSLMMHMGGSLLLPSGIESARSWLLTVKDWMDRGRKGEVVRRSTAMTDIDWMVSGTQYAPFDPGKIDPIVT
jgi:hypothetical protein